MGQPKTPKYGVLKGKSSFAWDKTPLNETFCPLDVLERFSAQNQSIVGGHENCYLHDQRKGSPPKYEK
jgi:hypothetical protein